MPFTIVRPSRQRRNNRVGIVALMSMITVLSSCGLGNSSSDDLQPLPTSVTTTTTASTLAPLTSTSSSAPTSSSTTSTSTTVASVDDLKLWSGGIGDVRFGVDPDGVVSYMKKRLGEPTEDSGYVDSYSAFGSCPGSRVRGVRWGDLLLLFGDESTVVDGRLHFFSWKYGPMSGSSLVPPNLKTEGGVTIGSTVSDLRRLHPSVEIFSDEIFGAGFEIERTLSGTLSSTESSGRVTVLYGGITCGE
ncbi:MAG: hypothetical protein ACKOI2_07210 [Actinomycetota bacterium]